MREFERFFDELMEYKDEYGDVNVKQKYVTKSGYKLGRVAHSVRERKDSLSKEEKDLLNSVGFVWRSHSRKHIKRSFDEIYVNLIEYKKKYGNVDVPMAYITTDNIRLGAYLNNIRTGARKTTAEEKERLEAIGFKWRIDSNFSFDNLYQRLVMYKRKYGNLAIPIRYKDSDNVGIGILVSKIRTGERPITANQRQMLDEIGFEWSRKSYKRSFEEWYELLLKYKNEKGNCKVSYGYTTEDGARLGNWLYRVRHEHIKVTNEQKNLLRSLGVKRI